MAESGIVYVLKADNGLYKIGRAKKFENRLLQLQTQMPYDLEVIVLIESDDYIGLEKGLHKRFVSKREKGEWFELSEEDIEYLKGLAGEKD